MTRAPHLALLLAGALLAGCSSTPIPILTPTPKLTPAPVMDIALIGFNDFHGNLEPPRLAVPVPAQDGGQALVPAGGAAYFASAMASVKARHPHHAVVSAGDMVSASPLVSALFLDESTVEAFNTMGVDFHAAGNHEFDKGWRELLRLQHGGCEKNTVREPCQLSRPFAGANFPILTANTLRADGQPLLAATGLKRFTENGHSITVGFIGLTLRATPSMVAPTGVAGLQFADEADTANALIPALRAQGADVIVVALHEGGQTSAPVTEPSCQGLSGDILPILERLDPAVDVVVSGHTHHAYVCDYAQLNPARPFLLTSAGYYGTLLTEITLAVDTGTRRVLRKSARQLIVQGEPFAGAQGRVELNPNFAVFAPDATVAQLVARYREAAIPLAQRPVGQASAALLRQRQPSGESALGNLIADAQLAATRAPERGGAQISFMHSGGLRADLLPDEQGLLRYGQLFAVQPFGNSLVVRSYSGAQLQAVLEQQFHSASNTVHNPRVLSVSEGFAYRYDLSQPPGQRVQALTLQGRPIAAQERLRVVISSYLAAGGDHFTVFAQGQDDMGGGQDLDVFEDYVRAHSPVAPPRVDRITRVAAP